jgi:EAL domain-containing protein (putative c-di-GMP-specific phosphodiesterase class I)/predicted RNase H-like HicB family nuclease
MLFGKTESQPTPTPPIHVGSEALSPEGASALAKVARSAELYQIVLEQQGDRWLARVPALPDHLAEGETPDAARQNMRDAISAHLFGRASGEGLATRFTSAVGIRAAQGESLERDLREALIGHEFRLYYQPTFDLTTGLLAGMEALIRWEHPRRGLMPPMEFIPAAEAAGLTASMDDWVLDEVCGQLKRWENADSGRQALAMSVNLSQGQLHRPNLAPHVIGVLRANGLEPKRLRLEVPEVTAVETVEAAWENLRALREAGVHLTLDDVSAERSALARLRDLTVDSIKIDRPLINELGEGGRSTALVETITLLAHAWGMTVTAEGVETAGQAAKLQALGCDFGQGFFFGRPAPSEQAGRLFE